MRKLTFIFLFFFLFPSFVFANTTIYFPSFEKDLEKNKIIKYYSLPNLSIQKVGDSKYYLVPDHLLSTKVIINNSNSQYLSYYPYGSFYIKPQNNNITNLYTSQKLDPITLLYYYHARYYNPNTAHFISADYAKSFNRYSYVANNPIDKNDPSGNYIFEINAKKTTHSIIKTVKTDYNRIFPNRIIGIKEETLWQIVDKANPLSCNYIPPLVNLNQEIVTPGKNILSHPHLIKNLTEMIELAKKSGIDLKIGSGYRSYTIQEYIYNRAVNKNLVALPGTSQHQTGLALDFTTKEINYQIDYLANFENSQAGQFLQQNAWKYGFVLPYTHGHDEILNESWHYLYIGKRLASAYKRWQENKDYNQDIFDFLTLVNQQMMTRRDYRLLQVEKIHGSGNN